MNRPGGKLWDGRSPLELARNWGPAFLILLAIGWVFVYYVPRHTIPTFLRTNQDQALAMQSMSRSLEVISGQNGKLDELISLQRDLNLNVGVLGDRMAKLEEKTYGRG